MNTFKNAIAIAAASAVVLTGVMPALAQTSARVGDSANDATEASREAVKQAREALGKDKSITRRRALLEKTVELLDRRRQEAGGDANAEGRIAELRTKITAAGTNEARLRAAALDAQKEVRRGRVVSLRNHVTQLEHFIAKLENLIARSKEKLGALPADTRGLAAAQAKVAEAETGLARVKSLVAGFKADIAGDEISDIRIKDRFKPEYKKIKDAIKEVFGLLREAAKLVASN